MKINSIFAGLSLALIALNASAFNSIRVEFPQGEPKFVKFEYQFTTGQCSTPANNGAHCNISKFPVATFPVATLDNKRPLDLILEALSEEIASRIVDAPWLPENNYMLFSIPGQPRFCYVDLFKNKPDIVVQLNMDGSCTQ